MQINWMWNCWSETKERTQFAQVSARAFVILNRRTNDFPAKLCSENYPLKRGSGLLCPLLLRSSVSSSLYRLRALKEARTYTRAHSLRQADCGTHIAHRIAYERDKSANSISLHWSEIFQLCRHILARKKLLQFLLQHLGPQTEPNALGLILEFGARSREGEAPIPQEEEQQEEDNKHHLINCRRSFVAPAERESESLLSLASSSGGLVVGWL